MDLIKRLDSLGYIGATPNGITRVAGSPADEQAKLQVSEWMMDDGMEVKYDEHNNLIGRLSGLNPDLPPIVVGSHIDTVVNGGKFDGAYGIIAGMEAAKELQGELNHPLEIVAFHDEEITMSGSRGYASDNPNIKSFVELHVEQGPVLEAVGIDLGVVTGVVGQRRVHFTVFGEPNHGGTTPMNMRDDALVKASKAVVRINELANLNGNITATVGVLTVSPNKFSIVPGRVDFTVQIRDTDSTSMENFLQVIHEEFGFAYEVTESQEPIQCDPTLIDCIKESATALDVPYMELPSRAGHDAQVFFHCPMAMMFVPSRGGISHSPLEYTSPNQCYTGLNVLIETLRRIDTYE